jgi:hypothetical protein
LLALQGDAPRALPAELRAKTRVVFQSARTLGRGRTVSSSALRWLCAREGSGDRIRRMACFHARLK